MIISNSSFLIGSYLVSAGFIFAIGVQASFVALAGYRTELYRVFSLLCLLAAGFMLTTVNYYLVDTVAAAAVAIKWQSTFIGLFFLVFYAFVAIYTQQRRIKPWLIGIALILGGLIVANCLSPYGTRYATLDKAPPLILPWGEILSRFSGKTGPYASLPRLTHMAILIWALYRSTVQFRQGQRRDGVFLATSVLLLVATYLWGMLIDLGVIQSVYSPGFAFLILIMLMSIGLALELRHQTSVMKSNADELRIAATAFETKEGIFVTDERQIILRVNKAFCHLTGYNPEEVIGAPPAMIGFGRNQTPFHHQMQEILLHDQCWQGEAWCRNKDGALVEIWLTVSSISDTNEQTQISVGAFSDITKYKAAEARIHDLAFYDPLTNLPNRRLLLDRLQQAITVGSRHRRHGAVLFIDLDNFKILNDSKGHKLGDILLIEVAGRLQTTLRGSDTVARLSGDGFAALLHNQGTESEISGDNPQKTMHHEGDTVARLGGDEFVVILNNLDMEIRPAVAQAEIVGEKLLEACRGPFILQGQEYYSSSCIGVCLFLGSQLEVDELLKRADTAMYQAKKEGSNNIRFYDPEMQSILESRLQMESWMRNMLPDNQLLLHYQPKVDSSGRIFGAEVLVRWLHPEQGIISPAEFIPLSEENGLILHIGEWVLKAACQQLKAWENDPKTRSLHLSVNVSAKQIHQPDFVARVLNILNDTGSDPTKLNLELTESMLMEKVEDVIDKMSSLKSIGISFALDDFGTGYSSLSYLKRLPLDELKIDQSFVRDLLIAPNDDAIACAIIALGKSMGLSVIAEGVELQEQRDFLAHHGCNHFQGYLFSRPVPIGEFEQLLENAA